MATALTVNVNTGFTESPTGTYTSTGFGDNILWNETVAISTDGFIQCTFATGDTTNGNVGVTLDTSNAQEAFGAWTTAFSIYENGGSYVAVYNGFSEFNVLASTATAGDIMWLGRVGANIVARVYRGASIDSTYTFSTSPTSALLYRKASAANGRVLVDPKGNDPAATFIAKNPVIAKQAVNRAGTY